MDIHLTINGISRRISVAPNETLLRVLRREGYFSVKHGCEDGTCGVCTVLVNGEPRSSCITLAAQVDGAEILTVEGLSGPQMRGWKGSAPLHPIQRAFIETGAMQSGYEAPALILAAKALLDRNPNPTEEEVRDALSGVLSRETGYVKPVQAVLRAAAYLRGEEPPPLEVEEAIPMPPQLLSPPVELPPEFPTARGTGPQTVV
ncbi:MAG: (2Fe-2S)-binding protein, partial [Chloroflexi bacterium]|nr:(2Fe-2S)-binding protein [Chloroflexota bacterium]